jgi:hypothetical protein
LAPLVFSPLAFFTNSTLLRLIAGEEQLQRR